MGKNIFHHQFTKLENARCRGGLWEPSNFVTTSATDRQLSYMENSNSTNRLEMDSISLRGERAGLDIEQTASMKSKEYYWKIS